VFTNLFRIRIKFRLKLKILLLRTFFETCYTYLTIDYWYLIRYVLQTRLLGILSFFMKEKSPLNNSINFIVVLILCIYFVLYYPCIVLCVYSAINYT